MTFLTQWSQGVRLLSAPKRKWTETDVLLRLGLGTVTSHHVCITELHATTELQRVKDMKWTLHLWSEQASESKRNRGHL